MNKLAKNLVILSLTSSAFAVTQPKLETQVVGELPYSNQWKFDTRDSYLYLSLSNLNLTSGDIDLTKYNSHFSSNSMRVYSIDYFKQIYRFAKVDSQSKWKDFSIWGRYSIGVSSTNGSLSGKGFTINSSVESSNLMTGILHFGPQITYERISWMQPYIGFELSPYFYRHSASLSAAESQGGGILFGPVLGSHFPLFFDHTLSLVGEVRENMTTNNQDNTFATGLTFLSGLGLVF
jgi:hypothetical protein